MATQRIESGQMQIRSVGGVPMTQVQQQGVDYIAPRVAAQGAGQLAQILDRMSASAFQAAGVMRQQEGLEFAAQNPLTPEQLQMAKDGLPLGVGKTTSLNFFDQAVAKARSLELAGHFEIEGRNELSKMLMDVEAGKVNSEQVSAKIKTMSDGYSKSLASIDPEASIKFRATMATHGNTVLNAAYKAELDRAKNQRIAKFDSDFDNSVRLLEATISQGSWTDANGQLRSIDEMADVFRRNVLTQSLLLGDKALQTEYSTKFETALRNAKINAVTKALMADANMADPEGTLQKLKAGDLGNMSPVLKSMITNDFDAVAKVTANFLVAVRQRKEIADANAAAIKKQGEDMAINLLEQIFPLPVGSPKRKQLIDSLIALPPGSVPIDTLKELLEPQKQETNQALYFNLLNGIYNNTITDSSQIWGLVGKGLDGKDAVAALKILQSEDRRDSAELNKIIARLAGVPVIPGMSVVIDPKGAEFQRMNELRAQVLQIQAAAAAQGKTVSNKDIETQLMNGVTASRNTETARAAQKRLETFARRADGSAVPGRDWITGPVTLENLPTLKQKAGNDVNKLRQIDELEKLLKQAAGETVSAPLLPPPSMPAPAPAAAPAPVRAAPAQAPAPRPAPAPAPARAPAPAPAAAPAAASAPLPAGMAAVIARLTPAKKREYELKSAEYQRLTTELGDKKLPRAKAEQLIDRRQAIEDELRDGFGFSYNHVRYLLETAPDFKQK